MEAIRQASLLNERGVILLATNKPNKAFPVLGAALECLSLLALAIREDPSINACNNDRNQQPVKEMLRFVVTRSSKLQSALYQSGEDDCTLSMCHNAFLFDANIFCNQRLTAGLCELCMAVVTFNLSLSCLHRTQGHSENEAAMRDAWSYCMSTLHRVSACSGEFHCRGLLVAALNNLCVLHFDLGEFLQYELVLTFMRRIVLDLLLWCTPQEKDDMGLLFNVALLHTPFSAGAA